MVFNIYSLERNLSYLKIFCLPLNLRPLSFMFDASFDNTDDFNSQQIFIFLCTHLTPYTSNTLM